MATSNKSLQRLEVRVGNVDCEHDAASLKRALSGVAGVDDVKVLPKAAKVFLTYDPATTSVEVLKAELGSLGFPPQQGAGVPAAPKPWRNPKVLTSALSGLLFLLGWFIAQAGAPAPVPTTIHVAAILIGGYFFGREAIEELIFDRQVGIEFLMSTAAIVSTFMGEAAEGAMLVFLYSISEAAEGYTEEKTRSAIKALMDLTPKHALVKRDGRELEIPVEEIVLSDVFIVRPGESVATDGRVLVGRSEVNQAPITGESVPVQKQPSDTVFAGTINGEGVLEVEATKTFAENTVSRIIQMVEEAQERKGKSQRFIERFGARYSPAVLLIGFSLAVIPPLMFGADWQASLIRATVFIVAAAPCALVISVPITLVASLGTGARQGVLIKGGMYLEELAKIKTVALDKTGTLTRGEPEVTDMLVCAEGRADLKSSQQLLALAAGIERYSEHPLARAIVRHAQTQSVGLVEVTEFQAMTGAGASGRFQGRTIYIGKPDFFEKQLRVSLDCVRDEIERLQDDGKTAVLLGDDESIWGVLALRDNVRPNARKAIVALHTVGVQNVVMLTGDNTRTAQTIARELGIDQVYADLKPEDKVVKVRELAQKYGHVAMVGDGVNDAPALAEATVGIAMGTAGTDVALETADVALMADDLEKMVYALRLARRTQSVVNQNLVLSMVVIGVLVVGAVAGVFSLPIAIVGHEVSEFVVIASGLRMLRS
ncbi:MAG: cadmium-translocating P-type ATPase [Pirellulales bacterium]|nr:cadmium-translocating P-type ATPase [Pirellulales bacterium]